ncbi:MAG: hypothetical protein QOG00_3491 [Pyrinomonadaceae bacterium]|nr:hypothetical protein [Pyrinomonadaceae bacterium]MDQ1591901.1 hypothetical protein [Pyrinomonadaceae bacterium]MDQ1613560.1 hypothetical protein [Pyrinomonadaceae bacterium]MDX6270436.1 hypothetical protein [Acidobacteriota bacterium]
MNTNNSNTVKEQLEQVERGESALAQPAQDKKPFVEPVVSVPVDVLEATAFFQGPTVDTIQTLTT